MEKVQINGVLRISSNMESNTFQILSASGSYLGDLYIVDDAIYEKLIRNFREYGMTTGEMKQDDQFIKPSVKLPITLEVKVRK